MYNVSFENVSSDLPDNPFLRLRLDAASRISGITVATYLRVRKVPTCIARKFSDTRDTCNTFVTRVLQTLDGVSNKNKRITHYHVRRVPQP